MRAGRGTGNLPGRPSVAALAVGRGGRVGRAARRRGSGLAGVRGGARASGCERTDDGAPDTRHGSPDTRYGCAGHETVRRARSGAGAGLRPETAVSGHTPRSVDRRALPVTPERSPTRTRRTPVTRIAFAASSWAGRRVASGPQPFKVDLYKQTLIFCPRAR